MVQPECHRDKRLLVNIRGAIGVCGLCDNMSFSFDYQKNTCQNIIHLEKWRKFEGIAKRKKPYY